MYVIVNISGKQFRAEKGQELKVPHQKEETGKKVSFDHVLMIDNGKGIIVTVHAPPHRTRCHNALPAHDAHQFHLTACRPGRP